MLQVDPNQSYLNLKIGLLPVLKAGSSGRIKYIKFLFKVDEFKNFMEKTGETCFTHIEKMIKMYGKNGFSAGDSLTWSDLFLYEITTGVIDLDPTFSTRYPEISKCRASVEKNSRVMDYIKNRPKLPL